MYIVPTIVQNFLDALKEAGYPFERDDNISDNEVAVYYLNGADATPRVQLNVCESNLDMYVNRSNVLFSDAEKLKVEAVVNLLKEAIAEAKGDVG